MGILRESRRVAGILREFAIGFHGGLNMPGIMPTPAAARIQERSFSRTDAEYMIWPAIFWNGRHDAKGPYPNVSGK